jgi:aspartate/methionine/tyrosine aminotransferase
VELVVVNFPHNPTGAMLQQQDWQQLVAACKAAGAWLFSDEMYRFIGERCPLHS